MKPDVSKTHTEKEQELLDDYHAKWSEDQRPVSQTNLLTKQKQTLNQTHRLSDSRKQTIVYQRGKVEEGEILKV